MKFTPAGGVVCVELTANHLAVRDTGVGIPAASIPHVFERFYQAETSRSGEGSGLGLAIAARIVETHGWTIRVDSRVGKGTVFTVAFTS